MAMSAKTENRVRRWKEQRWILDAVVATIGVEFDQARVAYTAGPAGPEALAEFRAAAARIKKIADIDREFAKAAQRREAKAVAFEKAGREVSARESYLIAALLWSLARWPIFELNEELEHLEDKMNECYAKYMAYAAHPIEKIEVPFGNKTLPGYLHLPRKPEKGEKFPCVLAIPGMDGTKENGVAMYGDKLLSRGIAIFAVDGPGQGECFARRINVTYTSPMDAAEANYNYLASRPEIDTDKIFLRGSSFGTFFGTLAATRLGDKVKGMTQSAVCHEPGFNTIFNMAAPSFKMRFMYMAGIEDEDEFDKWVQKLDLRPVAKDVKCPVQILCGEDEQLSPLEHTRELVSRLNVPKQLVIYEGANHGIAGSSPSAALGENPATLQADWLLDRIAGKPMKSEEIFIDMTGRSSVTPL